MGTANAGKGLTVLFTTGGGDIVFLTINKVYENCIRPCFSVPNNGPKPGLQTIT
jgi:hypothetical protein